MARIKIHSEDGVGIASFKCPGCESEHRLAVSGTTQRPKWTFNGSLDFPTLTPSILATTGPFPEDCTVAGLNAQRCAVCHSFVTNGRIQFLPDCTHALAGQTVDLPAIKEQT